MVLCDHKTGPGKAGFCHKSGPATPPAFVADHSDYMLTHIITSDTVTITRDRRKRTHTLLNGTQSSTCDTISIAIIVNITHKQQHITSHHITNTRK